MKKKDADAETNDKTSIEETLLQGKTMKIYWLLLTKGECGIREIQRELKIPSPATVSYHITKLVYAKLVTKTANDKYIAEEHVKTGILGFYIKIGRLMVPRIIFYFSFFFFGTLIYCFLILCRSPLSVKMEDVLFLTFSSLGSIIFLYEAYRIWAMKPL